MIDIKKCENEVRELFLKQEIIEEKTGEEIEEDPVDETEMIEEADSIKMLKSIAKKYSVNIIGGSFIQKKADGTLVNACPVINRNGELVCTYEKNHLYAFGSRDGSWHLAGHSLC